MATATDKISPATLAAWVEVMSEITYGGEILIKKLDQVPPHLQTKYQETFKKLATDLNEKNAMGKLAYKEIVASKAPFLIDNFDHHFRYVMAKAQSEIVSTFAQPRPSLGLVSKL